MTDDQLTGQWGHVRSSPWFWDLLRKMVLALGWSDGLKSAFSSGHKDTKRNIRREAGRSADKSDDTRPCGVKSHNAQQWVSGVDTQYLPPPLQPEGRPAQHLHVETREAAGEPRCFYIMNCQRARGRHHADIHSSGSSAAGHKSCLVARVPLCYVKLWLMSLFPPICQPSVVLHMLCTCCTL